MRWWPPILWWSEMLVKHLWSIKDSEQCGVGSKLLFSYSAINWKILLEDIESECHHLPCGIGVNADTFEVEHSRVKREKTSETCASNRTITHSFISSLFPLKQLRMSCREQKVTEKLTSQVQQYIKKCKSSRVSACDVFKISIRTTFIPSSSSGRNITGFTGHKAQLSHINTHCSSHSGRISWLKQTNRTLLQ